MPPPGETRFTHAAVVVRDDDEDGRYGRSFADVHAPFTLDAIHRPSASVLFRLNVPIIDSASVQSTATLLITPDRIASLRTTICDTSAEGRADSTATASRPALGIARESLGGVRLVRHIQFQLHGGLHPQLVVPAGFSLDGEYSDSPARRVFGLATWLATASVLSLYMPHNALPTAKLNTFNEAVRQFPTLTVAQRQAFERTVDIRRWYNGKGGIVVPIEDQRDSPSTPNRSETDDAAVAVDTPSGYEHCPPQYDPRRECHELSPDDEAGATPSTSSTRDDLETNQLADVLSTCPAADVGAPPEYNISQRQHILPHPKRTLQCGSEDVDLARSSKRRDGKPSCPSRLETIELAKFDDRVQLLLERQRQQIQDLQKEIDALKRRNEQLERRQDELEESQAEMQTSQSDTDDKVESLLVHASELEDECEALKSQLPDVGIEMEDWLMAHMDDRVKDGIEEWLYENLSDTIQDYVEKQVAAHMADVKAKVRSALLD
jgi:uncharacterized protein YeeX (DUF496 family)